MNSYTINATPAVYTPHSHAAFAGNPLIEALPPALSTKEIAERTNYLPIITDEDTQAPDYIRLALVEEINFAYIASPQLVRLYQDVYAKLMQGYRFRNPLDSAMQRYMYEISSNARAIPQWNQTTANVSLQIGPSGFGKTTTIENLRHLFPEVIQHIDYKSKPLALMQPVIIRVDCPSSGRKDELISSIWSALDDALGSDYADQYSAISDAIGVQRKLSIACTTHFIGMIIVDEVQNLHCNEAANGGKASPRFLEELFNRIGVPVLLVGTWQTVPLLAGSFKTTRRAIGDSPMVENPYTIEDPYWKNLVQQLWKLQYCHHFTELTDDIYNYIYFCTAGLPALLKRLMKAANKFSIQLGCETIDIPLLQDVYDSDFCAIHQALLCLRNGNKGEFEDLMRPEQILSSAIEMTSETREPA